MDDWTISDEAAALHRRALVWDNHVCMPLRPGDESFLPMLTRHKQAGTDVVIMNIGCAGMGPAAHMANLDHFRDWYGARGEDYLLIESADDIARARKTGQLAIAFNIEGMTAIGGDLSLIETYYRRGVRWMLIAYNQNNRAGGGCHDEDPGLTAFGREAIREMERVGLQLCCSHTGYRTAMEAMEFARKPVIFSHSNPRAMHDHPRNIPNELMEACAATGGVMGLNGIGIFLGQNDISTGAFMRHLDYAVEMIGVDHVGIGLDFVYDKQELDVWIEDMTSTFPTGWGYEPGMKVMEPERLPEITEAMLRAGYGETDIAKILGGNFMALAEKVWRPSPPEAPDQA